MQIQIQKQLQRKPMKGQGADFLQWGIYLVILGIVLAVGALILSNFSTSGNVVAGSIAANTLTYSQQGIQTIGQYLPLVALVVVASGIILLVVRAFTGATGGHAREF